MLMFHEKNVTLTNKKELFPIKNDLISYETIIFNFCCICPFAPRCVVLAEAYAPRRDPLD